MTEKRFTVDGFSIQENSQKGSLYRLDEQGGVNALCNRINGLYEHSEKLSKENEHLKKELHLMHMRTMFSTVKSFKGDVSKRYKYSEENDTIYDTANRYGQYHKILDKEITMLLNEYETILKELKDD